MKEKIEIEMWRKINSTLTTKERNKWNALRSDLWCIMDFFRDRYHCSDFPEHWKDHLENLEHLVGELPVFSRKDELTFYGKNDD